MADKPMKVKKKILVHKDGKTFYQERLVNADEDVKEEKTTKQEEQPEPSKSEHDKDSSQKAVASTDELISALSDGSSRSDILAASKASGVKWAEHKNEAINWLRHNQAIHAKTSSGDKGITTKNGQPSEQAIEGVTSKEQKRQALLKRNAEVNAITGNHIESFFHRKRENLSNDERSQIMSYWKSQGISWHEGGKFACEWMRACMAINKVVRDGGEVPKVPSSFGTASDRTVRSDVHYSVDQAFSEYDHVSYDAKPQNAHEKKFSKILEKATPHQIELYRRTGLVAEDESSDRYLESLLDRSANDTDFFNSFREKSKFHDSLKSVGDKAFFQSPSDFAKPPQKIATRVVDDVLDNLSDPELMLDTISKSVLGMDDRFNVNSGLIPKDVDLSSIGLDEDDVKDVSDSARVFSTAYHVSCTKTMGETIETQNAFLKSLSDRMSDTAMKDAIKRYSEACNTLSKAVHGNTFTAAAVYKSIYDPEDEYGNTGMIGHDYNACISYIVQQSFSHDSILEDFQEIVDDYDGKDYKLGKYIHDRAQERYNAIEKMSSESANLTEEEFNTARKAIMDITTNPDYIRVKAQMLVSTISSQQQMSKHFKSMSSGNTIESAAKSTPVLSHDDFDRLKHADTSSLVKLYTKLKVSMGEDASAVLTPLKAHPELMTPSTLPTNTFKASIRSASSSVFKSISGNVDKDWDMEQHSNMSGVVRGVYQMNNSQFEDSFQSVRDTNMKSGSDVRAENDTTNHVSQLLYHGTDSTATLGICGGSGQFKVDTKVKAGRMMGNGIYLADKSSKSAQYTGPEFLTSGQRFNGTLMLCEASIGNTVDFTESGAKDSEDTTFGYKGQGNLRNNEWCVKNPDAVIPRYLIDISVQRN